MKIKTSQFSQFAVGLAIISFTSCALAPVGSHFESASTLNKNAIEIKGSYDNYDYGDGNELERNNYNFGGTVGYGVLENFDLKLRYENLTSYDEAADGQREKAHLISLSPKYMVIDKVLSFKLPFNYYFDNGSSTVSLAPAALGTLPVSNNFDMTGGIQYQHFFDEDINNYLGASLGFGFSQNLDVWSLRPEVGFQTPAGDSFGDVFFLNYGVAFLYNFNLNKD